MACVPLGGTQFGSTSKHENTPKQKILIIKTKNPEGLVPFRISPEKPWLQNCWAQKRKPFLLALARTGISDTERGDGGRIRPCGG